MLLQINSLLYIAHNFRLKFFPTKVSIKYCVHLSTIMLINCCVDKRHKCDICIERPEPLHHYVYVVPCRRLAWNNAGVDCRWALITMVPRACNRFLNPCFVAQVSNWHVLRAVLGDVPPVMKCLFRQYLPPYWSSSTCRPIQLESLSTANWHRPRSHGFNWIV